jgi:hypothetical protein
MRANTRHTFLLTSSKGTRDLVNLLLKHLALGLPLLLKRLALGLPLLLKRLKFVQN